MQFLKRWSLFFLINILIVTCLSVIVHFLGIRPFLHAHGIDYSALMALCFVWGMGGSIISLLLSKKITKMLVGVRTIDESHPLFDKVRHLAQMAQLPKTPEVGIYPSSEINAFATGSSSRNSLVAVSSGLLERLNEEEVEGVLAHEIAHIANGDMVTMSLLQGVVNAFVMFLARVCAFFMANATRSRNQKSMNYFSFWLWTMLFQSIFMTFGYMVLAFYSRRREFRADEGGARFAGKEKMIAALERLQTAVHSKTEEKQLESVKLLKISSKRSGFGSLFATHPSLETRIAHLKKLDETTSVQPQFLGS